MKRTLLLSIIILWSLNGFGQSFNPEVISSGGDSYTQINGKMEVTIGETITETYFENSIYLTQGFQQGNLLISRIDENDWRGNGQFTVFPNPAINWYCETAS